MKSFKQLISEVFDHPSTDVVVPPPTVEIVDAPENNNILRMTYSTTAGKHLVMTDIVHHKVRGFSDIEFWSHGQDIEAMDDRSTKKSMNVLHHVISHIKHHLEEFPDTKLRYSVHNSLSGYKRHLVYQSIAKRMGVQIQNADPFTQDDLESFKIDRIDDNVHWRMRNTPIEYEHDGQ